jgi:16S rRNA (adenine1518-N6/adenine1519-N6)-dimethyltransferase
MAEVPGRSEVPEASGLPDVPKTPAAPQWLDLTRLRRLAGELGLHPSKGRGQNFLFDANTVRRIVALAQVGPGDTVLEIGPGLGSLTLGLLRSGAQVVAVEIEPPLAGRLPSLMAELAPDQAHQLTVIEADALRLTAVPGSAPTALIANLPYNIAVPVLLHTLASFPSLGRGLVMVQLEVADRLVAPPGSRTYGVPSAKLAWYAEATKVATVPASVFWPTPNVESGLVRFTRRPAPAADRAATFAVIDTAFSQRRKMVRSVLTRQYGPAALAGIDQAGLSAQARPETLSISDFARLAECLAALGPGPRGNV